MNEGSSKLVIIRISIISIFVLVFLFNRTTKKFLHIRHNDLLKKNMSYKPVA